MIKATIKLTPEAKKALEELAGECTPTWCGWQAVDRPELLKKQNQWLRDAHAKTLFDAFEDSDHE
jgi:hypothetical protein